MRGIDPINIFFSSIIKDEELAEPDLKKKKKNLIFEKFPKYPKVRVFGFLSRTQFTDVYFLA